MNAPTTKPDDRRADFVVRPKLVLLIVGYSVFVAANDLTVVSTMLRPIIGDLGLVLPDGLGDAAWLVNSYLIAFLAVMPIAGRLSDVLGRRFMFNASFVVFLVGSVIIPLSTEFGHPFGWFLVGRVLTALGGGAMVPVALAVVGDVYPEGERARALGTLGAIETLGWVWGPLYGAVMVHFLSWKWQSWLNVPLALAGLVAVHWALDGHDRPARRPRIDWLGAVLLTASLVALNVALLGSARIQSVNGLDELTGGGGSHTGWLFPIAAVTALGFVLAERWAMRRGVEPLFDPQLFRGRNVSVALFVNFAVGAGLIISMVDVPLFVNAVEVDLDRAAIIGGAVLSAMTAAMAVTSYFGGRLTHRTWYRPPLLGGIALATGAFAWMGATWSADSSYWLFATQLALLGAGLGLTVAPTTSAVVDSAPADQRGAAAGIVMVVRLLGLSVGLSALTAWGLARFNHLRGGLDLPPIGSPGFQQALLDAQANLTAQSIAETFTAAAVVVGVALVATAAMRRTTAPTLTTLASNTGDTAMDHTLISEPTRTALAAPDPTEPPVPVGVAAAQIAALQRRVNLLIGALGVILLGALACIAVLFGRVSDAQDAAAAARAAVTSSSTDSPADTTTLDSDAQAQIDQLRADLDRVEAGAALYASQLEGYQQLFAQAGPEIAAGVDEAIAGLQEFGSSSLDFELPLEQTVQVPIQTEIPIDQSFDTTIKIATPLGFEVPLDVTVPVDVKVPVDLTVDIPVKTTVPISIDISQTEFKNLTDSLATGLGSLKDVLNGLSDGAAPASPGGQSTGTQVTTPTPGG